jgi:hypothetical protein
MDNETRFTWIPTYQEIHKKIRDLPLPELVSIIKELEIGSGLTDRDAATNYNSFEVAEIDPFTFISLLNKYGEKKRVEILQRLHRLWDLQVPLPTDVNGLPTANAQNVWWFGYQYRRKPDDIRNLRTLYLQALDDTITPEAFQKVLEIRGVGKAKLTEGLFFVNPELHLPINGQVIPYLEKRGIKSNYKTLEGYYHILEQVRQKIQKPFYEISYDGYIESSNGEKNNSQGKQEIQYWKFSSQKTENWDMVMSDEIIGLTYTNPEIPDLSTFASLDDLKKSVGESSKNWTFLSHLYDFRNANVGSVVIASPSRTTISAIGIISGPYQYNKSALFEHSREVEWLADQPWQYKQGSVKNYELPFANDPFCFASIGPEIIREYIKAHPQFRPVFEEKGLLLKSALPASGGMFSDYPKNIILYGPPGTGKTYATIDLAVEIVDDAIGVDHRQNKRRFDALLGDQIEFITFHQNYTYEDFIMGIKPDLAGGSTGLQFRRHEGIFYKMAERARKAYEASNVTEEAKRYVLIIDEINRANMSRVFGELITLLEVDKRIGGENEIRLILPSGEQFALPPNLYILGTMNTADKSLALLDVALRRRFEFIGKYPQYEVEGLEEEVSSMLRRLNQAIYNQKQSPDFLIGHAYFLHKEKHQLKDVFHTKVIPLLMEYFSGRPALVESLLSQANIKTRLNPSTFQLEIADADVQTD